jgi:hypothetical protein
VIAAINASSNRPGGPPISEWADVGLVCRAADSCGASQHISGGSSTYAWAACNDGGHFTNPATDHQKCVEGFTRRIREHRPWWQVFGENPSDQIGQTINLKLHAFRAVFEFIAITLGPLE